MNSLNSMRELRSEEKGIMDNRSGRLTEEELQEFSMEAQASYLSQQQHSTGGNQWSPMCVGDTSIRIRGL